MYHSRKGRKEGIEGNFYIHSFIHSFFLSSFLHKQASKQVRVDGEVSRNQGLNFSIYLSKSLFTRQAGRLVTHCDVLVSGSALGHRNIMLLFKGLRTVCITPPSPLYSPLGFQLFLFETAKTQHCFFRYH